MPKYIKYRVSTLSGNIAGDYKDYLPRKTDVVNGMMVTKFPLAVVREVKRVVEGVARDAVENYTDIIAVGRGTLVDPEFGHKIMTGKGDTIVREVTPEHVPNMHLTPGLFEAFTRTNSLGLPPLPGAESIYDQHRGTYDNHPLAIPYAEQ